MAFCQTFTLYSEDNGNTVVTSFLHVANVHNQSELHHQPHQAVITLLHCSVFPSSEEQ